MIAKFVNLALLGLWPLAWTAPLASTEVAWLFTVEEVSILSAVQQLWEIDWILAVAIALFAVVIPYLKTLALVFVQFSPERDARIVLPALEVLARLSMADVFLIALSILVYRGIGAVQVEWGLYLFTGLVLVAIWAGWATMRSRYRLVPRDGRGDGGEAPMTVPALDREPDLDPAGSPTTAPAPAPASAAEGKTVWRRPPGPRRPARRDVS